MKIFGLDSKYHFNINGMLPRFANNFYKQKVNNWRDYKFNYEPTCGSSNFRANLYSVQINNLYWLAKISM